MIRPRLPKVSSGTRLTTNLVNNIINRTEYAADLLRQYKLVAGTEMYVEPHYDGTRVSYLQPVGGGATPTRPIEVKAFRIITSSGFIYEPIATESFIEVPFKTGADQYYGISGNVYFGWTNLNVYPFSRGIITFENQRNEILFGDYTRFYGGDDNFAVGEYYDLSDPTNSVYGVKCNIDGSGFQKIEYPNTVPSGTYLRQSMFLSDIDNGNIIGEVTLRNTVGLTFVKNFLRTASGNYIDLPARPYKIYGNYVTLIGGYLYNISTGQANQIFYNGQNVALLGIYKNFVNGYTIFGSANFLYNIDNNSFLDIYASGEDMG